MTLYAITAKNSVRLIQVLVLVLFSCFLFNTAIHAQEKMLRVGLSMSQTGPLAGGGKAALLGLNMWRDDVNGKGGLLGRKVELVVYDDQSITSNTPGIYAKLLDVDKVDFLIAPYGTNMTAPIMPMVKQRHLLLMGNFSFEVNEKVQHDMWFNNAPWNDASSFSSGFIDLGVKRGGKTVAFLATDAEFSQTVASGARTIAKKAGLTIAYDQKFPPNTTDFSSMIRALKASKPDIVFIASYPGESIAIVRAINEVGVGSSVKILGGGMVGLQFAPIMEGLGSQLNGIVNYNTFVPEGNMYSPEIRQFLERYAARAKAEKIDPLGFYIAPFAYAIGEVLGAAISATKSIDQKALASFIRDNEHRTLVGPIKYGRTGEWANPRVIITQFRGVKDKNVEQFREAGRQLILSPELLKTGDLQWPYEAARK